MEHAQALADVLVAQRNEAMNALAMKSADLAVANEKIAELMQQLAEVKNGNP